MVAAFNIVFDFGGVDGTPGTQQDIDTYGPPTLRFKYADNATIDSNARPYIPGGGLGPYYSFWKHIYLYCDNPDGHTINNLKFYTDGVNNLGTGLDIYVGLQFPDRNSGSTATYEVATGDSVTGGDELVAGHGGITSKASIFDYTAGAGALAVTISEATGVINAAGETSDYILLQGSYADSAAEGLTTSESGWISYDEA
jgi:hypothetical protein